jgi:hypothetical protein|tara:strand:- start:2175 stop:2357 length:183 start_codon:yes stop_codon:yes gene_type:complete
MSRVKYTCRVTIDVDDQEYPVPVDGDLSTELHELISDVMHEFDGIYMTALEITKRGRLNG